jgi:nucleoside-diphosphate-sugar epimerase
LEKTVLRSEDSSILDCNKSESNDPSLSTYGKRKANCERLLKESGLPFFILRPALVYGRYDITDRFYYWLYQIKKQDDILLPNNGCDLFSVTYVNDLINAMIAMISQGGASDIYNVTTFPTLSISRIVDKASKIMQREPNLHYAMPDFLNTEQIREWQDLPLWLIGDFFTYDNSKLIAKFDTKFTDFEESLKQTIDYYDALEWPVPKYGLSEKRKLELINKLNNNS